VSPVYNNKQDPRRAYERLRLTTAKLRIFLWGSQGEAEPNEGFGFVSDFSQGGLGIYLGQSLRAGESVRISLDSREGVTYRGTVAWCNRFSLEQNFFGHDALSYRVGIKFLFGSEAERQRYLEYYRDLQARALRVEPGMKY
jgi:hypothetical protein